MIFPSVQTMLSAEPAPVSDPSAAPAPEPGKTEFSALECIGIAIGSIRQELDNPDSFRLHSLLIFKGDSRYQIRIGYSALNPAGEYTTQKDFPVSFITGEVLP